MSIQYRGQLPGPGRCPFPPARPTGVPTAPTLPMLPPASPDTCAHTRGKSPLPVPFAPTAQYKRSTYRDTFVFTPGRSPSSVHTVITVQTKRTTSNGTCGHIITVDWIVMLHRDGVLCAVRLCGKCNQSSVLCSITLLNEYSCAVQNLHALAWEHQECAEDSILYSINLMF